VIAARVHPVIPANDPLATHIRPASASVFIKYRPDANLQAMAPAIKNLVMRSIEGLEYENIALTFVAAEEPKRGEQPSTADPRAPIKAGVGGSSDVGNLIAIGTLLMLVSSGLGALGYQWLKQHVKATGNSPWADKVR
jgi:type III secretion protein J